MGFPEYKSLDKHIEKNSDRNRKLMKLRKTECYRQKIRFHVADPI